MQYCRAPLSEKLTQLLIKTCIISEKDRSIYLYGFHQLFITILNMMTSLLIGFISGMLWETLCFLTVYISLRKFAGGFHATTEVRCYFLSTVILIAALIVIAVLNHCNVLRIALLLLFLLGGAVVVVFAPVGSKNKPLDDVEEKVYRNRSILVMGVQAFLFVVALVCNFMRFASVIAVGVNVLAIVLIAGLLKR